MKTLHGLRRWISMQPPDIEHHGCTSCQKDGNLEPLSLRIGYLNYSLKAGDVLHFKMSKVSK